MVSVMRSALDTNLGGQGRGQGQHRCGQQPVPGLRARRKPDGFGGDKRFQCRPTDTTGTLALRVLWPLLRRQPKAPLTAGLSRPPAAAFPRYAGRAGVPPRGLGR